MSLQPGTCVPKTKCPPTLLLVCLVAMGVMRLPASGAPGVQQLRFSDPFPNNTLEETLRRLDIKFETMAAADVALAKRDYELAKQTFEVVIPSTYTPDTPHGLFVWVGVGPVSPAWHEVFARRRFICVTAVATNARLGLGRLRLPLDAVHNLKRRYRIDEDRVYISGFSAGAGLASHLACGYPEVFHGGCFLLGARFYLAHKVAPGNYEPTLERIAPEWKGPPGKVCKEQRLVLVRAEGDTLYSPQEDRAQFTSLWLDGFERVNYIVLPSGGHVLPNASSFEGALQALDSPPRPAPVTTPTQDPNPLQGQVAQAQRILATALLNLERKYPSAYTKEQVERFRKSAREKARQLLHRVVSEYPTTPAAARARGALASLEKEK